jgi:hypothetical protein
VSYQVVTDASAMMEALQMSFQHLFLQLPFLSREYVILASNTARVSSFYSRVPLMILDCIARRANTIWLLAVVVWWTSMISQKDYKIQWLVICFFMILWVMNFMVNFRISSTAVPFAGGCG